MAREATIMADFTGGWITDRGIGHLQPNELAKADNLDISIRGGAKKRNGLSAINASYGANVTQLLEWPRKSGYVQLMAVMNSVLYEIAPDGTRKNVYSLKDGKDFIDYFSFNDKLYFLSGSNLLVYDGISCTQIQDPLVPTLSVIDFDSSEAPEDAVPLAQGKYKVAVTFELEGGGSLGPFGIAEINITQVEKILKWTNIPQNPADELQDFMGLEVVGKTLWRTRAGTGSFLPVFETNDLTKTTFIDAEQFKGFQPKGRFFSVSNHLPAVRRCELATRHPKSMRAFYAGDPSNRAALFYSEPNLPGYIKGSSVMYPSTDDGPITGLATFMDAVVVFFQRAAYIWRGIDPDNDAIWMKLPITDGAVSHRTICQTTNALTYLGRGGIYSISPAMLNYGVDVIPGTEIIANLAEDKIVDVIKNIPDPSKCVATFDNKNKRYILSYHDVEISGSGNNALLVFEEKLGSFVRWQPIKAHCVYCSLEGELYVGIPNYICTFNGATDMGNPVKLYLESIVTPNSIVTRKIFHEVMVSYQSFGGNFSIQVQAEDDPSLNLIVEKGALNVNLFKRIFRELGKFCKLTLVDNTENEFVLYAIGLVHTTVNTYGEDV